MLLFVGLGNPGSEYQNHRHNIGFMAVDRIVRRHVFSPERTRFNALVSEGMIGGEKILTIKPQTFMNRSGQSVGEAMRFYKLTPADVVVFYDELDLAFAKIKVKTGGGAAGHNGIRSIDQHIGADFMRVRLGIGHPGDKSRVTGHVLGNFAKAEEDELDKLLDAVAAECGWLAKRDPVRFMTDVARHLQPPKPEKKAVAAPETAKPKADYKHEQPDGPLAAALRAFKNGDK
ncbi:aminoacyl-tRNA hydrolase [Gimibacter soli]|uniref:Peptidyl-tRNA hydrolase n=1 Tax=Gimibacter soli TaxID=3024400 RepID=A0AAF0BMW6_9PROT|nr:aminoacyl-tRNA hydrolase [Gimibacter soli]WCL55170.1 aminoacyl-tRNA hydrolase [Gimibacter soli]